MPIIESPKVEDIQISAWIPWWNSTDSYKILEEHNEKFTSISPYWYKLDARGVLIETEFKEKADMMDDYFPVGTNVKVLPMITSSMSIEQFTQFVSNEYNLNNTLDKLISDLLEYKVSGIDVDFEDIDTLTTPEYKIFLSLLSKKLKDNDLLLYITIPPHADYTSTDGLVTNVDFYTTINMADQVRLMLYDFHYADSKAGSIAPNNWYERSILSVLKYIPRDKLVVGLPAYGYFWGYEGSFKSLTYDQYTAYKQGKEYYEVRDSDSGELVYVSKSEIGWISDGNSIISKIQIAKRLGITKFVIWSLSGMDKSIFLSDLQGL